MKQINFDEIIDRKDSGCFSYNGLQEEFGRGDLLPLWVADMDFATPPFIIDALKRRLDHPILGYPSTPAAYRQAIVDWVASHHQWNIRHEWVSYIPGIVRGIGLVVNRMTTPDDEVVIMPPIYHPFRHIPEGNKRKVVECPLKAYPRPLPEGKGVLLYPAIDFDRLETVCNACSFSAIPTIPSASAGTERCSAVWHTSVTKETSLSSPTRYTAT